MPARCTVSRRVEVAMLGSYCEGEVCYPIKMLTTYTQYANGDWVVAVCEAGNPLNGEQRSGEALSGESPVPTLDAIGAVIKRGVSPIGGCDAVTASLTALFLAVSLWVLCELWPALFLGHGLRGIVG